MINRPKSDPAEQAKRLFATEDKVNATQEAEKDALALRENMARLRELRLAKEAQEAQTKQDTVARRKPKKRVRSIRVAR